MSAMKKSRYVADSVGLVVLMALVAILSSFVSTSEVPRLLWIPIYAAWAVGAIFVWHQVESTNNRWTVISLSSIGGAVLWYFITRVISRWVFGDAESELSKIIDLLIALVLSPGLTFVAIAGWAREFTRSE